MVMVASSPVRVAYVGLYDFTVSEAFTITLSGVEDINLYASSATIDANDSYLTLGINGGTKPYVVRIDSMGVLTYRSKLELVGQTITAIDTYDDKLVMELGDGSNNYFVLAVLDGFINVNTIAIVTSYTSQTSDGPSTYREYPLTDYFKFAPGEEGSYSCGHYSDPSNKAVVKRNCDFCPDAATDPQFITFYEFALTH